ncbi:MAG: hypothetical protein ACWA45_11050 [Flavobacteriales bacterium]
MSDLSKVVDSVVIRTQKLVQQYRNLKSEKLVLEEKIKVLKQLNQQNIDKLNVLQLDNNSLKLANSMLGSDQYKRETKLKINALVRKIDTCIAQLSD